MRGSDEKDDDDDETMMMLRIMKIMRSNMIMMKG